ARLRRTRRGSPADSIRAPIRAPRLAASSEDHPPTRRIWDDLSERDSPGNGAERHTDRIRWDRDDKTDPHVPRVELLHLFEVAQPCEKREDGWHLPRGAIDRGRGPVGQRPRQVALPSAAGEMGDRVDRRDLAEGAELGEIRAMHGE